MELSTLFVDSDGKLHHLGGLYLVPILDFDHFNSPVHNVKTGSTANKYKYRVIGIIGHNNGVARISYNPKPMTYITHKIIYIN